MVAAATVKCLRCRTGFVYRERDEYGAWDACLNCGWTHDDGRIVEFNRQEEHSLRISEVQWYRRSRTRGRNWGRTRWDA